VPLIKQSCFYNMLEIHQIFILFLIFKSLKINHNKLLKLITLYKYIKLFQNLINNTNRDRFVNAILIDKYPICKHR